jgi:hypothetical protein
MLRGEIPGRSREAVVIGAAVHFGDVLEVAVRERRRGRATHSSVVASHGFESTFFPFQMLQKRLKMKGICATARVQAPIDMKTFHLSTPWACE